jgi:hypothetical protein
MTKKGLLTDLLHILAPVDGLEVGIGLPNLLLVTCSFLRKLCTFEDHAEVAASDAIACRLALLLPCSHAPVVNSTLRFLFNLSFREV